VAASPVAETPRNFLRSIGTPGETNSGGLGNPLWNNKNDSVARKKWS
jgi:hypothetical protein